MQYAKNNDLIAENPVLKINSPRVEHKKAPFLSEKK